MPWYRNLQVVILTASGKMLRNIIQVIWRIVIKIDNETGAHTVTNIECDYYKQLFKSVNDTDDKLLVLAYIRNNLDTTDTVVTVDALLFAIEKLPDNIFLNTSWAVSLTYWIVYLHFFVF